MTPVHIIGHPGSGKTTLVSELIDALLERNIRVGTLKHSAHPHELDKPGKDSYKHRTAGAYPVSMVNASMAAIYLPRNNETDPGKILDTYYSNTEIVLIEGWISGPYHKIELWRTHKERTPLFYSIYNVVGVICDEPLNDDNLIRAQAKQIRLLKRFDLNPIVDLIMGLTVDGLNETKIA